MTPFRPFPLLALVLSLPLSAQEGQLSLDKLFHPTRKVAYLAQPDFRLSWLSNGKLLETRKDPNTGLPRFTQLDPRTGKGEALIDPGLILNALVAAGCPEKEAKEAIGSGLNWNPAMDAFLVTVQEDLFWVSLQGSVRRLTQVPGSEDEATFSPDGKQVAFLRGNDLYTVEVASGRETRLTTGGTETQLNGRLDWVYQEEIYGRGSFKGFWWSPDSQRLAFLSLDISKEPLFTLADDRSQPQKLLSARYPKAGDPNPVARLGVVDLQGKVEWAENPYPGQETLIARVGFDPQGRVLAAWQDRIQTWMDLRRHEGTRSAVMLREAGPAWQEDLPLPRFLKDGRFVVESDRSGFRHLYLYAADGKLIRPITAGSWDVRSVHGIDEKGGRIFLSATERSPIGQDAYSVALDAKAPNTKLTRITQAPGTHVTTFSPDFSLALNRWTSAENPAQQQLLDASGKVLRTVFDPVTPAFKAIRMGQVKFQKVMTRDGVPMEAQLILPPDFDPKKKYPVFQMVYGGPGAPSVRDAFGRETLWSHFLAQQGIVTFISDNRSASKKGSASAHGVYKRLGAQELQDLLDGVAWLKQQGWADTERIALEGWSYGGYMTAYALTHAKAWKLGIIGAPVTDYRLYDSIYTERYMGLPKDNPEGYAQTNLMKAAPNLHGKVLMLHGTLDDNVHPQNTIQFLDALQKAGHPATLVLLPGCDHSPRAPQHQWARFQAMWDFLKANL